MAVPVVHILEGLFFERDGVLMVDPGGEDVGAKLSPLVGRTVEVAAHHFPPSPPILDAPGLGCCLWAGFCPCGHREDPTALFSRGYRGVLEKSSEGIWNVGGEVLPLRSHLLGHRSRLVLFAEGTLDQGADAETLLGEAAELLKALESLRKPRP